MQPKELIIFDMDGTLIDSGDVIANTINFVRTHLGLEEIKKKIMLEQLNNPEINSSLYFYGTKEFTPQQTELFTAYYNENCIKDIKLYEGIKELIDALYKDFTLTIATNASREFATKMIEHLQIDSYFATVVGASCVQNPKPHPDMLLKILDDLQIGHQKSLLIGDSLKDIQAAKAANIDSYLVDWGFSNYEEHDTIKSSSELLERLKRLK